MFYWLAKKLFGHKFKNLDMEIPCSGYYWIEQWARFEDCDIVLVSGTGICQIQYSCWINGRSRQAWVQILVKER